MIIKLQFMGLSERESNLIKRKQTPGKEANPSIESSAKSQASSATKSHNQVEYTPAKKTTIRHTANDLLEYSLDSTVQYHIVQASGVRAHFVLSADQKRVYVAKHRTDIGLAGGLVIIRLRYVIVHALKPSRSVSESHGVIRPFCTRNGGGVKPDMPVIAAMNDNILIFILP